MELPQELNRVHHTFHVSNLKKCYADEPLVMSLEGIHIDYNLQFVEEPVEIMEREIKRLKQSRIPLVKVRWNSRRGREFTWVNKARGDDANRQIDKFLEITQHMKQNGVSNDALRLSLFPYSLTHHAIACHRDTINAAARGTFMQKTPEECYELIENMTAHHNHWDTSATRDETSRNISSTTTTESPEVVRQLEMMNKNFCPTIDCYTQEANYATTEPEVAPKPKPKPLIPYPSRLNDQKLREKVNNQMLKFLGRPFLRTARVLIDVYGEELTLRVNDEAITFKVGQTSRYSDNYKTVNQVNVIDVACKKCSDFHIVRQVAIPLLRILSSLLLPPRLLLLKEDILS
ncbi:hypothetical protein Tco_1247057 [Tanacetum coccineum]